MLRLIRKLSYNRKRIYTHHIHDIHIYKLLKNNLNICLSLHFVLQHPNYQPLTFWKRNVFSTPLSNACLNI